MEIGEKEKCSSCKTINGRKKECQTYNDGYFISQPNSTFCKKCSLNNCKKCSISNGKEVSEECLDSALPEMDNNGIIHLCNSYDKIVG